MFFASKCSPLSNCISLPSSLNSETEARLTSINFSYNDIPKNFKIFRYQQGTWS